MLDSRRRHPGAQFTFFTGTKVPILTLRKLQDHDRGIILGETTYGKGLVQQLQRLGQGGQQIKFTIGKYYTPSGRCIQSKTYSATGGGKLGTDETQVCVFVCECVCV